MLRGVLKVACKSLTVCKGPKWQTTDAAIVGCRERDFESNFVPKAWSWTFRRRMQGAVTSKRMIGSLDLMDAARHTSVERAQALCLKQQLTPSSGNRFSPILGQLAFCDDWHRP